jgi:DNA-binding NarL/FixJ family response regulator
VRLLIVDDDEVYSESLRHLLDGDDRIDVVGTAHDLASAMAAADGADAVLVDVRLRTSKGYEIVAALRDHHRRIALLMMSALDATDYEREALEAGADGIVPKGAFLTDGADALVRAVADLPR